MRGRSHPWRAGSCTACEFAKQYEANSICVVGPLRKEKEQWPDGLDELLPLLENNQAVFHNPLTGDKPGYEYVKPSGLLEEIKSAETIVLYQLRNGQRDRKLAVAFLDGQVPEP